MAHMAAADAGSSDADPSPEASDDTADDAARAAADKLLDLLYTGVGLGVIAVNKAQVARRNAGIELPSLGGDGTNPLAGVQDVLNDPETLGTVLEWIKNEARDLDERLDGFEHRLDDALDRLGAELPESAQTVVSGLRSLAADHAVQFRAVLGLPN